MSVRRAPADGLVGSSLLSDVENQQLARMLGHRRVTLATAVAQLVVTSPPSHTSWRLLHTGAVCFTRDNVRRAYFLQLYGADALLWEQELYHNFQFRRVRSFFSTFETDASQAGLNFADESEAERFASRVQDHVREKSQKETKRSVDKDPVVPTNGPISKTSKIKIKKAGKRAKNKKGTRFCKEDISAPSNFEHLSHVGWDPNKGFDLENVEPSLKGLFNRAGVSNAHLQDQDTREFIYNFINRHGGVAGVSSGSSGAAPPPPPPPPPPPAERSEVGGRGALLDSIRSGTTLRPVTASPGGAESELYGVVDGASDSAAGIAAALARALTDRKHVMHSSDEEEDEDDEDQDEWDD